jgi:hypothetical protein
MYALAPSATVAVGASWSRSQEWLSCARVLWDRLHGSRSNPAAQEMMAWLDQNAAPHCKSTEYYGDLEQPARMGGRGRFTWLERKVVHGYKDAVEREKK